MNNKRYFMSIFGMAILIASLFVGCTPEELDAYAKYCEGRNCGTDGDQPNSNSNVSTTYTEHGYAPCCQCDDGRTGNSCQTYMYNQFFRKDYTVTGNQYVSAVRIDPAPPVAGDPNVVNFLIKITTSAYGTIELNGNLLRKSEVNSNYGDFEEFTDIKDLYIPVIAIPAQTVSGFQAGGSGNFIQITDAQYHQFQKTAVGLGSDGERPTTAYFDISLSGTESFTISGTFNRVM